MLAVTFVAAAFPSFSTAQSPAPAPAPIKAAMPPAAKPAWTKGIQPLNRDSYYHAIECGKQGGAQSPCVFYDTDLCKNEDYTVSMYSPYKQVAYEVWAAVSRKQDPPEPSYRGAQQTKAVVGIAPVRGSKNPLTKFTLKRGASVVAPVASTLDAGGGNFIYDFPAFAPTGTVTLEMAGKTRTQTCVISPAVLARFR
jgi:hypothetical protein